MAVLITVGVILSITVAAGELVRAVIARMLLSTSARPASTRSASRTPGRPPAP